MSFERPPDAVDEVTYVVDGEGGMPQPRTVRGRREPNDPIDPLAAPHPGLAAVEAEQRKKPDGLTEVLDDKTDVDEAGDTGATAVH